MFQYFQDKWRDLLRACGIRVGSKQKVILSYILHPIKTVYLASKICPTKVVHLGCNEVHLIKAMTSAIKLLCREMHGANQILN